MDKYITSFPCDVGAEVLKTKNFELSKHLYSTIYIYIFQNDLKFYCE